MNTSHLGKACTQHFHCCLHTGQGRMVHTLLEIEPRIAIRVLLHMATEPQCLLGNSDLQDMFQRMWHTSDHSLH